MIRVVTDYLDLSAKKSPKKVAFADKNRSLTYKQLRIESLHIAQGLINLGINKSSVVIFLDKSVECISCMMGVAYSGNYYTVIDTEMPNQRIERIMKMLNPKVVITSCEKELGEFFQNTEVKFYSGFQNNTIEEKTIYHRTNSIIGVDILTVAFTSGSTGIPKGVVISHRATIDGVEARTKALGYMESDIFANQFPFYFASCCCDLFATLKCGATDYIIPPEMFYSPCDVIKFLSIHKVTILDWIAPALCLLANFDVLGVGDISSIRKVVFGGEPMPIKILKKWKNVIPKAVFVNAYGSTEFAGCAILFYTINRVFEETEILPLGTPVDNTEVIILGENGLPVKDGEIGEMFVRTTILSEGYYADTKTTEEKFVQNPLNNLWKDIVYKTGDLVRKNIQGDLEYIGRKDFQIKKHGYRIEMGEIEACACSLEGVEECVCIYNGKIILYFCGEKEERNILQDLKKLLPSYMTPDLILRLNTLPRTVTGKIDRKRLINIEY